MHRTIHEALELRDLITECETIAGKLLHAVATCRDADTGQMLGAHERAFRQHARQLRQMLFGGAATYAPGGSPLAGSASLPGATAAYPGPGAAGATFPGAATAGAASPGARDAGAGGPGAAPARHAPGGNAPAGYAPDGYGWSGYPAAGPSGHGFRPMRGGAPDEPGDRGRAHDRPHGPGNANPAGPSDGHHRGPQERDRNRGEAGHHHRAYPGRTGARLEFGPGETRRTDRPELIGWEPGAGNNEGWQAGARRDDLRRAVADVPRPGIALGDTRLEAASPLAPGIETFRGQPGGREPERPAVHRPGPAGAEAFTAVRPPGNPYSFSPQQDQPSLGLGAAPASAGQRPERTGTASPRVDFAPALQPTWPHRPVASSQTLTGSWAGAAGTAGPQGHDGIQHAPRPAGEHGAAIADPDALAVADCMKDCKHVAVRLVMAAAECADRHLRRSLYQMAGEHLEMAAQHFEWLQRRHLYNVAGAGTDLVQSLEQDIRRLEQAVRVEPSAGAMHEPRHSPRGHGGAVNTDTAYGPAGYGSAGALQGGFGGWARGGPGAGH